MQTIFPYVRADAVAGPGAVGLTLIVASLLVILGVTLCAVVFVLAALRTPMRAISPAMKMPRASIERARLQPH